MDGQETQQTRDTERFVSLLRDKTGLTVHMQDEALTSQKAEAELQARHKPYQKGDVDALAATYILEDYLHV
jgi:putative holliday junction resolvase